MGLCSSVVEGGAINPQTVDISHFEVHKTVGKGGFGKVNAVTDRKIPSAKHEFLAMKTMTKASVLKSDAHVVSVMVERSLLATCKSPFLVDLKHAFQDEENLYLLMTFMGGGDLDWFVRTHGAVQEKNMAFYAAEILLGLEAIHRQNYIYRDLKPKNILLDNQGHVKISDFGLAVGLHKSRSRTVRGVAGTPGYMAPEVLSQKRYGFSQDIWSFGVVLYELIHKSVPFPSHSAVITSPLKFSSRVQISAACKSLLRGLLEKDPSKRLGCGRLYESKTDEKEEPRQDVKEEENGTDAEKESAGTWKVTNITNSNGSADSSQNYVYSLRSSDSQEGRPLACEVFAGWEDIKQHEFFKDMDWTAALGRKLTAPFTPDSQIANCSSLYDLEDQMYGATKPRKITLREQAKFAGFDYNTEWKQQSQQKKKKMEGKEKALEVTTSSDSVAKTVEVKPIRFIKVM